MVSLEYTIMVNQIVKEIELVFLNAISGSQKIKIESDSLTIAYFCVILKTKKHKVF